MLPHTIRPQLIRSTATPIRHGVAGFARGCRRRSLLVPIVLLAGASGQQQQQRSVVASALSAGISGDYRYPTAPAAALGKASMFRRSPRPPTPTSAHMTPGIESTDGRPTRWDDPNNDAVGRCVPPLTSSSHKGSSGRVGVLGGSARYTGAPYYAAMASLKVGADLAFVFCAAEAAVPIKCYSPELMVASVYSAEEFENSLAAEKKASQALAQTRVEGMEGRKSNGDDEMLDDKPETTKETLAKLEGIHEEQQRLVDEMVASVTDMFDRLHVLIIGPGLGRCPLVLKATAQIMTIAKERNVPMVIDADGLFLLTQEPYGQLVAGCKGLVLTPNAVEAKRLAQTMGANMEKLRDLDEEVGEEGMSGFERATEGAVIVKKGSQDIIFSTVRETSFQDRNLHVSRRSMLCDEEGGLKRSGGLGDILSGCIGTFVAWNHIMSRERLGRNVNQDDLILACWSACCITKRATRHAFEKKRRSMTAPDVLKEIGEAVDEMTGDSIE